MNKLKILVEGYAKPGPGTTYQASPTCVLIYHNDLKILVDPGANKERLLNALKEEDLVPNDIDILFLSHYHPDHFLNLKLFPNNALYDGSMLWKDDTETAYSDKLPGTEIQILPTPGHSAETRGTYIRRGRFRNCLHSPRRILVGRWEARHFLA